MPFKRLTTIQLIIAVIVGLGLALLLYTPIDAYLFNWQYTGFGPKTIWDWLELLIIPVVLAVGGYLFNRADKQAELERAEQQARTEREIADDRLREEALQTYLDRMSELLVEKGLRESTPDAEVRSVARARTLAVLRRLDGGRKGAVVQFLHEAQLIEVNKSSIVLKDADLKNMVLVGADLRGANLAGATLSAANLQGVDLRAANLDGSDLGGANLFGASLVGARFMGANFFGASLAGANLKEAILRGATLTGVRLTGANLMRADLRETSLAKAILRDADLTDARVTHEQLAQAESLTDATMPDGSMHD